MFTNLAEIVRSLRPPRPLSLGWDRAEFRARPWRIVLPAVFGVLILRQAIVFAMDPSAMGWHATFYTDAAAAWLSGANPWLTGPPGIVFAGPPTMLLIFAPWMWLSAETTRIVWVVGSALLAVSALRRLHLPLYFIAFPPLFESIVIGHPEVLVLWLLISNHPVSGLAAVIKPYAIVSLIAERRLLAIAVAATVMLVTAPFLPWPLFIADFGMIQNTLSVQANGDSVFGTPLMIVAIAALAVLGWRRALWLVIPVLWPNAQFNYKVGSIPQLSPILALFWAFHLPGATLLGLVAEALLLSLRNRLQLPNWLEAAVTPIAVQPSAETI